VSEPKNGVDLRIFIDNFNALSSSSQYLTDLMKDATGQATEALSRTDWFIKWGQHYLPSLAGAHFNQLCNNFKDPGVQHYSGALFESLRDELNDLFNSLPPPTPSICNTVNQYGQSVRAPPPPPANMSTYNDEDGTCFDGDCLVKMSDGTFKLVRNVRVGDTIMLPDGSSATVTHCVKYVYENNEVRLTTVNDLLITPWHPIRMNGTWVFPGEVGETKVYNREQVYNFVLGHGHIVTIGGIECATLGHGFTDNNVIQHDYFGTHQVINDLIKFPVDSDGSVVVLPQHVKRDDNSKRVVGIA
jgi:Hint-domain/VWA / Hh  protein intein-like